MCSMAEADSDGTAPGLPVKRSLFKRSAWAKPAQTESDEAIQLFSRSKEIFSGVVAENERRRLERQAKLQRAQSKASIEPVEVERRDEKRRRVSTDRDEAETSSDEEVTSVLLHKRGNSRPTTSPSDKERSQSTSSRSGFVKSPSPKSSKVLSRRGSPAKPIIISLSESEDDTKPPQRSGRAAPMTFDDYDDDSDDIFRVKETQHKVADENLSPETEDEEFPELVARARENARNRVLERLNPNRANSVSEAGSDDVSAKSEGSGTFVLRTSIPDPVIQILITANIEGTNPLVLKRKLSQRMKDVRMAWCDRQKIHGEPMSANTKAMIFLTWRGHRIFDVSTGRSLGLKVGGDGGLMVNSDGFEDGKVHLEAWTDETFNLHKAMLEAERKKQSQDPADEEEPTPQKPVADQEPKMRIVLKARDFPEFKIYVKSTTLIRKMIDAFRKTRNVPSDKQISLRLDGEELEPASTVADADMEDLTTVDVHVS